LIVGGWARGGVIGVAGQLLNGLGALGVGADVVEGGIGRGGGLVLAVEVEADFGLLGWSMFFPRVLRLVRWSAAAPSWLKTGLACSLQFPPPPASSPLALPVSESPTCPERRSGWNHLRFHASLAQSESTPQKMSIATTTAMAIPTKSPTDIEALGEGAGVVPGRYPVERGGMVVVEAGVPYASG